MEPVKTMRDHAVEHLARARKNAKKKLAIYEKTWKFVWCQEVWDDLPQEERDYLKKIQRANTDASIELKKCESFAREMGVEHV